MTAIKRLMYCGLTLICVPSALYISDKDWNILSLIIIGAYLIGIGIIKWLPSK